MAKICIGTAQLGLDYGINNKSGKPSMDGAFRILDFARCRGIEVYDTAPTYGNAELILGTWLKDVAGGSVEKIITKIPKTPVLERDKLRDWVLRCGYERLEVIGQNALHGILLHSGSDIRQKGVMEGLEILRQSGTCNNIGISTYYPEDAIAAIEAGVNCIQVPYNVFDQRFEIQGVFKLAEANGVQVFARSPFLQGLLFMSPEELPATMSFAMKTLERWKSILDVHQLSPLEGAMQFCFSASKIDYIVLGVETESQLDAILRIHRRVGGMDSFVGECKSICDVDSRTQLPFLW